ncbi:unnamed protein product [Choristocarpus tenellus]
MDSGALMLLNNQEELILPVQLKVRMLMEQALLRSRCRAMVEDRIIKLERVVRVQALFAIIDRGTSPDGGLVGEGIPWGRAKPPTSLSPDDVVNFRRMAVCEVKNILYDLAEEGSADCSKDLAQIYDGLVFTEDIAQDAAKGFASVDEEALFAPRRSKYRRLMTERWRFLIRKLGVMLDMQDDMDGLLASATQPNVRSGDTGKDLASKSSLRYRQEADSESETEVETDEDSSSSGLQDQKSPSY